MKTDNSNRRLTAFKSGRILNGLLKEFAPVYPIVKLDDYDGSYILYQRNSFTPADTKDRNYLTTVGYEIVVVTDNYSEGVDIIQNIWARLEGLSGELEGLDIDEIRVTNAWENWSNDKYTQRINISVAVLTM